jgi:hypothetical protein
MKKSYPVLAGFFLSVFLLSGCAQYSLVKAGNITNVGNRFRIDPQIDWSMSNQNDLITWTVDGPILQKVHFFPGIENGKPLIKPPPGSDKTMPVFSSTMTPIEVMDLVEATLARQKALSIKKENIKPAPFGKLDGFRFTFSFSSEEGLEYKGFAAGTIKDQKLYLIVYSGTNIFYYDRYVQVVEKIVDSVEII